MDKKTEILRDEVNCSRSRSWKGTGQDSAGREEWGTGVPVTEATGPVPRLHGTFLSHDPMLHSRVALVRCQEAGPGDLRYGSCLA